MAAAIMECDQTLTADENGEEDVQGFTEVRSKKSKRSRRSADLQGQNSEDENYYKKNRTDKDSDGEQQQQQQQASQTQERDQGREEEMASPTNGPQRLLFPPDCELTIQEKILWTVKLAREHRAFTPLFKDGKHRPYITVSGQEAVDFLTGEGYQGLKLKIPEPVEQTTKIIIFRYPLNLDPDFICDDPRVIWAHRHKVRGQERSQAIALIKGKAPSEIFVTGIGYKPVSQYAEEPQFCLRCARWGHTSYRCQSDPRCRYCGRPHDSSLCSEKIKQTQRVIPRCANCKGEHNARSTVCPLHPRRKAMESAGRTSIQPTRHQGNSNTAWAGDGWASGRPILPGETATHTNQRQEEAADLEVAPPSATPPTTTTTAAAVNTELGAIRPGSLGNNSNNTEHSGGARSRHADSQGNNDALCDLVMKLCDKIEQLESEVKEIKKNKKSVSEKESKAEAEKGKKESDKECKVKINGKPKVVKSHKVMSNGVEGIERLLRKCRNDESKKAKVFEGWKEMHRCMDRFMREMEEMIGSVDNVTSDGE